MPDDPFDLAGRFRSEAGGDDRHEPAAPAPGEAAYVCDACGEEIVVPVDPAAGPRQEYVEDCPVCCRPNLLTVTIGPNGEARCDTRPE